MFDVKELGQDDLAHVVAILEAEALKPEDIAYAGRGDIITSKMRLRWFKDEDEAEEAARVYLTGDSSHLWRQAVSKELTTDGLIEWANDKIKRQGWARWTPSYDGCERVAELKDGTWFPYIRV
ncbi:MAG: hypothetical protein U9N61_00175 [Euryarchaeota archaeon]|nr:hypothetical protein [Euryarchaeota archaeon]